MGGMLPRASKGRPASAAVLIDRLLAWYDRHRRRLPWRAEPGTAAEPYEVLLSEIMLQQTTAATVSRRFPEFLARFPSLDALAAADQADVLHAWQGLGYYRRARALHALARAVVARHDGRLPSDAAALQALPGIGPYTASALRAIAFGQPAVPVDGNVAARAGEAARDRDAVAGGRAGSERCARRRSRATAGRAISPRR